MIHSKFLQQILGVVINVFLLSSCSGALFGPTATPTLVPPTATPTLVPGPKTGSWEGENVSFTVTEQGTISDFKITVDNCQVNVNEEIVVESTDSLNSFVINPEGTLSGNFDDASLTDFSASAQFDSEASVNGTYNWKTCGNMHNLSGGSEGSWTAQWQQP